MEGTTGERSSAAREASRRNGAASRGPSSTAGKAQSARNALKHGLRSARFMVPAAQVAGPSQIEEQLSALAAPVDGARRELIGIIIGSHDLLRQVEAMIGDVLAAELGALMPTTAGTEHAAEFGDRTAVGVAHRGSQISIDLCPRMPQLELLLRYEKRFRRRRDRAMRKLLNLCSQRKPQHAQIT